jgi:multidrug resistance efflux pump
VNKKKVTILSTVGGALIAVLAIGGVLWYNNVRQYVSTKDAFIDGNEYIIAAPASGKVIGWKGAIGTTFQEGSTIGDVQTQAGDSTSNVAIQIPANATVVEKSVQDNEFVGAGQTLAYAYQLNRLFVTANVKETDIRSVGVGTKVDITIDAYPGTTLHGTVERIGLATASNFSMLPSSSQNANFTKVTQVVPVKIDLNGYAGLALDPGMDASVRIHKSK